MLLHLDHELTRLHYAQDVFCAFPSNCVARCLRVPPPPFMPEPSACMHAIVCVSVCSFVQMYMCSSACFSCIRIFPYLPLSFSLHRFRHTFVSLSYVLWVRVHFVCCFLAQFYIIVNLHITLSFYVFCH